jgi:hypothetical protein
MQAVTALRCGMGDPESYASSVAMTMHAEQRILGMHVTGPVIAAIIGTDVENILESVPPENVEGREESTHPA